MVQSPKYNMNNLPPLLNELYVNDCFRKETKYKYYNLPNNLLKMTIHCLCYGIHNYLIQFTEITLKRIELIIPLGREKYNYKN